jgi:glycosyltransferase involved in cell wall biosynthesis
MLSAIVITKNEEQMIGDCLKSLKFADEKILIDTGNTDKTNVIATKLGWKIFTSHGTNFSDFRNDGLSHAKGEWILYLDADERLTPESISEVQKTITDFVPDTGVFALPRTNYYLGKNLKYGGWGDEYIIRLFKRTHLSGWKNPLHEEPVFTGAVKKLTQPFIHISHRDLTSMLKKTIQYTDYEAQLRFNSGHPHMTWWRFFRVMFTEFYHRFVQLSAWKDGTVGVIEGLYQVFNMFIIYARLWELQVTHAKKSSHH